MSSRYDRALFLTLKLSVSPALTLIWVAKPWMAVLPDPEMSQVLLGVPGLLFSQAIGLTSGAQGSAANAGRPMTVRATVSSKATAAPASLKVYLVGIATGSSPVSTNSL